MARHLIRINAMNPSSVSAAVTQLKNIKTEIDGKMELYMDRLAEVGQQTAQSIFGGATTVTVEKSDGMRRIVAQGTDEAYFVEFGTGAYAGSENAQYLSVPSIVYPGSYSISEKGKHTWSAWINAGNSGESYRYNSTPKSAMYKAYEAMCTRSAALAKEVFGAT